MKIYYAIVWSRESEVAGFRVTIAAESLAEASEKLKEDYGPEAVFSLWNDEYAAKPR